VQSTDADGNALGGIRDPLLAAPLGTHVGWSLRAKGYGEDELSPCSICRPAVALPDVDLLTAWDEMQVSSGLQR